MTILSKTDIKGITAIKCLLICVLISFISLPLLGLSHDREAPAFAYKRLFSFPTIKGEGEEAAGKPRTIAINSLGNIYIVVPYAREVRVYNTKGAYMFCFGRAKKAGEKEEGSFSEPSGICIDNQDVIYVSDLDRDMILIFNSEGKFREEFPIFQPKGRPDSCAPFISVDSSRGLLYIPDPCIQLVNIYTLTGQFVTSFGEMGSGPGAFGGPANCAFNSSGDVYIIDPGNFRIQCLSPKNTPKFSFGTRGVNEGEFIRPYGIAIDAQDRLFVSDFVQKMVHVFDNNGKPLGRIQEDLFQQPLGIVCFKENQLYVVDGEGKRVDVFQMD